MPDDLHDSLDSDIEPLSGSHGNIGTFFSNAQDFTISGGTFRNSVRIFNQIAPGPSSDLRTIRIGDINLLRNISLHSTSATVSARAPDGAPVRVIREMYSARVHGCRSRMTVALYSNDNEALWREAVSRHFSIRNPSVLQLFGIVNSGPWRAAIYHDDMIPAMQLTIDKSPAWGIYYRHFLETEFKRTAWQILYTCHGEMHSLDSDTCTFWIRPTARALCLELISGTHSRIFADSWVLPSMTVFSELEPTPEEPPRKVVYTVPEAITSLSGSQFLQTCCSYQERLDLIQVKFGDCPALGVVLGSVYRLSGREPVLSITTFEVCSPVLKVILGLSVTSVDLNYHYANCDYVSRMGNGWLRVDVAKLTDRVDFSCEVFDSGPTDRLLERSWLAQAGYIIPRLNIAPDVGHADFVVWDGVWFTFIINPPATPDPRGFLFICPESHFCLGGDRVGWPAVPSYYSLDPSGVNHMTNEEQQSLGLPEPELTANFHYIHWNAEVYTALEEFFGAKGFDTASRDIARHLGLPLMRLATEFEPLFYPESDDPETEKLHLVDIEDALRVDREKDSGRDDAGCSSQPAAVLSEFEHAVNNRILLLLMAVFIAVASIPWPSSDNGLGR